MPHYKCLFLILSSTNLKPNNGYYSSNAKYEQLKQLISAYYPLFANDIHFYFLEARPTQQHLVEWHEAQHMMTIKTNENIIPGMMIKIKSALQAMFSRGNITFDHVVCTNLSTVFNFPLFLQQQAAWPKTGLYGGHFCADHFVSGTCIVMSPDVAKKFTTIPAQVHQYNDLYMHNYITFQKNVTPLRLWPTHSLFEPSASMPHPPYRMHKDDSNMDPDVVRNYITLIRIRSPDNTADVAVTKKYLQIMYPSAQFS